MGEDEEPLRIAAKPRDDRGVGDPGWPSAVEVIERLPARPGFALIALADHGVDAERAVTALQEKTPIRVVALPEDPDVGVLPDLGNRGPVPGFQVAVIE